MTENNCIYEKIIVIGYGKIVNDILRELIQSQDLFGYKVEYIRHEASMVPFPKTITEKIVIHEMPEKKDVTNYLLSVSEKTLIVSAGNNFIFPKSVLDKENIFVINFHNALLPNYRGRNAASWAIYYNEKESGPTWHIATSGVDEGGILYQKKCPIHEDMKAYELARDIMLAAFEGFKQIYKNILTGQSMAIKPQSKEEGKMFYSYDVPNDGWFSLNDNPADIYRLLRATDYGLVRFFPYMKTKLPNEDEVEIISYKKRKNEDLINGDNMIQLPLSKGETLEMEYRKI